MALTFNQVLPFCGNNTEIGFVENGKVNRYLKYPAILNGAYETNGLLKICTGQGVFDSDIFPNIVLLLKSVSNLLFAEDAHEYKDFLPSFRDKMLPYWSDELDDAIEHLFQNSHKPENIVFQDLPYSLIVFLIENDYDVFGMLYVGDAVDKDCL